MPLYTPKVIVWSEMCGPALGTLEVSSISSCGAEHDSKLHEPQADESGAVFKEPFEQTG